MLQRINDAMIDKVRERLVDPQRYQQGRLKTGFHSWDHITGGLGKGELIVLGGRPGMGRTSLACSVTLNVCLREWKTCFWFSAQDSACRIVERLIKIKTGMEADKICRTAEEIKNMDLWICESKIFGVKEIVDECQKLKGKKVPDLIVVDYLQLLRSIDYMEDIRGFKSLAQELDCPVLLITNVSRACEYREDKRPQIQDLENAEAFDRYADTILFLYREDYYHCDDNKRDPVNAHLYFVKDRWGSNGGFFLDFYREFGAFYDCEIR